MKTPLGEKGVRKRVLGHLFLPLLLLALCAPTAPVTVPVLTTWAACGLPGHDVADLAASGAIEALLACDTRLRSESRSGRFEL